MNERRVQILSADLRLWHYDLESIISFRNSAIHRHQIQKSGVIQNIFTSLVPSLLICAINLHHPKKASNITKIIRNDVNAFALKDSKF